MNSIRILIFNIFLFLCNIPLFAQHYSFSFDVENNTNSSALLPSSAGTPTLNSVSKYFAVPKDAEIEILIEINKESVLDNIALPATASLPADMPSGNGNTTSDTSSLYSNVLFPHKTIIHERLEFADFDLLLVNIATERYNADKKELHIIEKATVTINTDAKGKITVEENAFNEMLISVVENPDIVCFESRPHTAGRRDGANYLIITPDNDEITRWADTLRTFREQQGIITKVMTLKEIRHNTPDSLKAFLRRVYYNWDPRPAAVLLLGDFNNDPALGISSFQMLDHPQGSQFEPYLADNKLVDFNNNGLPSMVIARMPAANAHEAHLMVQKTIDYERHPYSNPDYYAHPTTSMAFQLSRWFQLCTEIIAGYFDSHDKKCNRINAIYEGPADSLWSTAQNTNKVVDYFGENGLNYIPDDISHLSQWDNDGDDLSNALENGTFLLIHRDHGTFETWGMPFFSTDNINKLHNEMLSFVMSVDCQTGAFDYGGDIQHDCLAERFLRINNGAMAVIAASQLSYSFVNDTYTWGVFDYLFPDFIPDFGDSHFDFKYPAFANAYGKYYLKQSSFPYNDSYKTLTNNLLHYFGDAYLQIFSEVPQNISVTHPEEIDAGSRSVTIFADSGSSIALSIDNELIAKGKSQNGNATLHFNPVKEGAVIKVVLTKQNHYRHESLIRVKGGDDNEGDSHDTISVFPNPVEDVLKIKGRAISNIKICNSLGQTIIEHGNADSAEVIEIDCSSLPHGAYYIIISSETQTVRGFVR